MLKAGFMEVDYTPEEGWMPGQIERHYAKGVRTPIMAHAAVIESGANMAVLISLDILFVSQNFTDGLRRRISERIGVPGEYIFIAATHTHTGCGTDVDCWGTPADAEMAARVQEAAFDAAVIAWENRVVCRMGVGTGFDARFNFCRDWFTTDGTIKFNPSMKNPEKLVRPYAAVDHTVNVIRFDDMAGRPLCFVVNYANHLDTNNRRDAFSADYAGFMRLALRREYGDVAVLFLNGCCGNVNHYDFATGSHLTGHCREGVLPSEEIGNGLAETVEGITPAILTETKTVHIQSRIRSYMTSRRLATEKNKAWAREWQATREARLAAGEKQDLRKDILAELYLCDESKLAKTVDLDIQVMQLGPIVLVGLPGEVYSDVGLKIKALSPFPNTVVVELVGGHKGYITPEIIQRSGCYEGTYSNIAFAGPETPDMLVEGAVQMLKALYEVDNHTVIGDFAF